MGIYEWSRKAPNNIQEFLGEAFSLYAWCLKKGPNNVGETFGEYFGSNEEESNKLKEDMRITNVSVEKRNDSGDPLLETIQWCIHKGDKILWNKTEEKDGRLTFIITYRHKPTNVGRKPVISTEYDFEQVWTITRREDGRYIVVNIDKGKNIQNGGGMTNGDFEMPGKKTGDIINKKKWAKKGDLVGGGKLPCPF